MLFFYAFLNLPGKFKMVAMKINGVYLHRFCFPPPSIWLYIVVDPFFSGFAWCVFIYLVFGYSISPSLSNVAFFYRVGTGGPTPPPPIVLSKIKIGSMQLFTMAQQINIANFRHTNLKY